MTNSKIFNSFTLIAVVLCAGCVTSSYQLGRSDRSRQELIVTPDRVVMTCTKESDDGEVFFGFMVHVLDDEKTVLDIIQGNRLDEESCLERIHKIGKILNGGNRIYISGMGSIIEPRTVDEFTYTFPKLGTFHGNGRVLQFAVIANANLNLQTIYPMNGQTRRARSILSWAFTPNNCNYTPIWGNALNYRIRLDQ